MTKKKGETENGSTDHLGFRFSDLDCSVIGGFSNEDFGSLDLDELGFSGLQSDHLGGSYFGEGSPGLDLELTDAESAIIRLVEGKIAGSRGRVAAAKSEKIYITHEDFDEGPERDAFLLIFGYAEHLFEGSDKKPFEMDDPKKLKAIRFFFCRTRQEMNLEDAVGCIDNQIRTDVLRLRFMLEFWLRGWTLPPMPEDADGVPSRIELMAAQHGGMIGLSIAKEVWYHPGIDAAKLLEIVLEDRSDKIRDQINQAFKDMVCSYILSLADTKVYITGKNPILELEDKLNDPTVRVRGHLANIYWSRKF
jgi:hypothetical protein